MERPSWWRDDRGLRAARMAARVKLAGVMAMLDVLLVAGSYFLLVVLRFDAAIPDTYWRNFGWFLVLAVFVHVAINLALGLYSQIWRHASVNEARRVLEAGGLATAILTVVTLFDRGRTPLSVPLVGGILATGGIGVLRFQSRLFALRRRAVDHNPVRIAVIGAGEAAAHIVREMLRSDAYEPVIVLDDDEKKWGMSLLGCPVTGPIDLLCELADSMKLESALLAIPSAPSSLARRVEELAADCKLSLKVMPGVNEMLGETPSMRDVRDLEIADLLGRSEVRTDLETVRRTFRGKTVLVTGAGGSIGSEIVRQVSAFEPGLLVLVDCDETHLHDAMAKVVSSTTDCRPELLNIRDRARVFEIFERYQPDVVLHAAALKHVPVLERNAREAVRTNILGMEAIVDASTLVGVERFVFVSTDKAVNPSSVMGATKWFGEQLLLARGPALASWCCVRFGNVLGSRGSVLPTFERQIRAGGPVTVTDERMTRFFMSVQEAVQLVLQAGAMSSDRSIYMLEMGEPVLIADLAKKMIRLTGARPGVDIEIEVTGTRPGEKLHEQLHTASECLQPTDHPSIAELEPLLANPRALEDFVSWLTVAVELESDTTVAERLHAFVATACDIDVIDLRDHSDGSADLIGGRRVPGGIEP